MSFRSISFDQTVPLGPFLRLGIYRYFRRPLYLIMLGLLLFFSIAILSTNESPRDPGFLIPLGVVLILMPLLHLWGLRYLHSSSITLKARHHVSIDEGGILVKGEGYHSFLSWSVFTRVKLYKNWVLIFTGNSAIYLYLPELEDASEREILRVIVSDEIKAYRKIKSRH